MQRVSQNISYRGTSKKTEQKLATNQTAKTTNLKITTGKETESCLNKEVLWHVMWQSPCR